MKTTAAVLWERLTQAVGADAVWDPFKVFDTAMLGA